MAKLGDFAQEYLGSGYDLCGEYADGVSIKRKIFDLECIPEKDIRFLPNRSADFFSTSGQTVNEYQNELTAQAGVSGSYGLFSGSVKSSFSSSDLSIEESSYVSIQLCMRFETWKLQLNNPKKYVYPDVLDDFKTKDGKWLIKEYGGGVVIGMDVGGRWIDNLAVSKLYQNSTREVTIAMQAAYGFFVSGEGSTKVSETVKREAAIASRKVNVIGGNPQHAPGNLDEWQQSVETNLAFMNFTKDGLLMIWEIFPEYEEKLKKGFEEYVKENQLLIEKKSIIEGKFIEGKQYANDRGSGAKKNLALFRATPTDNVKYVGVNGNDNTVLVLKEVATGYGALREPIEWQPVWNDRGSKKGKQYNVWIPVGPPDFVALGVYCRFNVRNNDAPSKEEANGIVVVHKSLVEDTYFEDEDVWNDIGSHANFDVRIGRLPHKALWPVFTNDPEAQILPSKYTLKKNLMNSLNPANNQTNNPRNRRLRSFLCCV